MTRHGRSRGELLLASPPSSRCVLALPHCSLRLRPSARPAVPSITIAGCTLRRQLMRSRRGARRRLQRCAAARIPLVR